MTDREKAIKWWDNLDSDVRVSIVSHEMNFRPLSLKGFNLTGREIENIWQQLQTK